MADKRKTLEEFEALQAEFDPNDVPLVRAGKNWWDSVSQRGSDIASTVSNPDLGVAEKVAVTASNVVGMGVDTVLAPMGFAADAAVPGKPMEAIGEAAMNTEAGQHVAKFWDNLSDEDKVRLRAGAMPLEAVAARLGFSQALNPVARNAWSLVPDFYSGNPVAQGAGVFTSFANKGTSAALRQAVSPSGQALLRQGVPQGLVDEISGLTNAIRYYDQVQTKRRSGEPLTKPETEAWKIMQETGTVPRTPNDNGILAAMKVSHKRTPGTPSKIRSFIEGALMTRVNLLRQQGKDTGVLETLIENPLASNVSRIGDPAARAALGTLPTNVADRLMNHVKTVHKVSDDDIILNRSSTGDVNISNEAWGQKGTAQGRLYLGFRNEAGYKGQLAKAGIEKFDNPNELRRFVEASNIPAKDQSKWVALGRKLGTLNKQEQKTYDRIEAQLNSTGRVRVSEPDAEGFMFFQSSHSSQAKELGGVNVMTAVNPETGQAFGMLSDGSDLFGVKGPGNKSLVTVVDPVEWNIYNPERKGGSKKTGAAPRSTRQEAIEQTAERTGIQPQGTQPLGGGGMISNYAAEMLPQYKPKAQARDYISAGGNVAKLGVGTGMLATRVYGDKEE